MDKLKSDALQAAAAASEVDLRTVLVEIDAELPSIVRAEGRSVGERPRLRFISTGERSDVTAIRTEVEAVVGRPVEVYLASSRVFVVQANGAALRKLAELPAVIAVWPNHERRFFGMISGQAE